MEAVILAAGKGTRFLPLTETTPKALIPVHGKPVIHYSLEALSPFVNEIIIITGHLENELKEKLGNSFNNTPITYITQGTMKGTAGALWSAKEKLQGERFIVANCDDIFFQEDIKKMVQHQYAMGVFPLEKSLAQKNAFSIQSDENGIFTEFGRAKENDTHIKVGTGIYLLDDSFFKEKPGTLSNNECGIPQTLKTFAQHTNITVITFSRWLSINSPEEQKRAETALQN